VTRPIRYIVPFGAGPTAAQAQWLAHRLSEAGTARRGLPAESIKDLIALARRRIVQIAGIRPD
jgi:hypothetical protein